MRLNQYIARGLGLSRRQADELIAAGKVSLNKQPAKLGNDVREKDEVSVNGNIVNLEPFKYLLLNKPVGYVCSRRQQGSIPTIYELIPPEYHHLKPVGRLDKDSSGILLLTDDGQLAQQLTHPKYQKVKVYEVKLNKEISPEDMARINNGIKLDDGTSNLQVEKQGNSYKVTMHEGRNRQIRRTFDALDYKVVSLNRTVFGNLKLSDLQGEQFRVIDSYPNNSL